MTMIEIPRLMPQGRVAVADPQELGAVAAAGDGSVAPRRRRRCPSLAAKELLDIPVTYLDPGELLDEAAVLTLASCSFIFTPPKGGGPTSFTPAQKGQLVAIYRSLPYGAKGTWLARQKISSATISRWGQRLGLPPVSVAKLDAMTEDISSRLSPRAMTYLTQMYAVLPYQEKQAFLIALGMTHMEMSKWIAKTADGSIGQYAHKRKAGIVGSDTHEDTARTRNQVARMITENDRLKKELAKANRKLKRQDAELDKWKRTSDVLGKALASMPDLPGVDYNEEENPYPKTKHAAMRLADKKNTTSSRPSSHSGTHEPDPKNCSE